MRASPAVITLPVTSTPEPPRASSGPASASSIASSSASASRGETLDPVGAEDVDGQRAELVGRHGPRRAVLGDDQLGADVLERGEDARRRPCRRTQPTTPTSRVKSKDSLIASTVAAMPAGLCAASTQHGRRRAHPLQPARRAHGGEGGAHGLLLDRAGGGARAEERLDGGQRGDRVLRLVGAEQRQEDLLVLAAQALQPHLLPADGDPPLQHAELGALAGDDRLHLDRPADQRVERARLLVGEDARWSRP